MQTPQSKFDVNELDWLAFRYVAGELNESEAAQFEARLAVDQLACEAVARNVELTSMLSVTLSDRTGSTVPETGSVTTRSGNRISVRNIPWRSRWGVLTGAAALAVLAVVVLWKSPSGNPVATHDESLANAEQLVALWSEPDAPAAVGNAISVAPAAGTEDERPAFDQRFPDLLADVGHEDAWLDMLTDSASETGEQLGDRDAVPDWLVAGVSLELTNELQVPAKGAQ